MNKINISNADFFLDKDVILWGGQNYVKDNIERVKKIKITHIFPDGELMINPSSLQVIEKKDLLKLKSAFVLIGRAPSMKDEIQVIVNELRDAGIDFDHLSHFVEGNAVSAKLLMQMGKLTHCDPLGNFLKIDQDLVGEFYFKCHRGGRENYVEVGKCHSIDRVSISCYGSNACVTIGNGSTFVVTGIEVGLNGEVYIGENCMFSHGIVLGGTDQHPIFDLFSGKRLNYEKPIVIEEHVWVGRDVKILGGANIGGGSIVGASTVTSSRFKRNSLIVGSPGKVLREGVFWARDVLASDNIENIDQCKDKQGIFKS